MKVVAFNGSARKGGNTADMIKRVFVKLEAQGIETEMIELAGKKMHGCIACYKCAENKDRRCAVKNDFLNECIEAMETADGIILGSPTYFATITTEMSALIDRAGMVSLVNGNMLARKVGAAVVAARRGGAMQTFNTLNSLFFIQQMIVPGSRYWNMGFGRETGEVLKDEEGMLTMDILGDNMAWLMKKLQD
ncbi:flavodoxin family protein [Pseudodesulfovibrio indicus]|uniref:flavodoxin family protein n=1 Tax=Pseudodesulfovibrio indicus TaxID=1716143 RepID=UPI00293153B4|nr:flavodoxin family protein [Pseudodesulfovibrio indicus]